MIFFPEVKLHFNELSLSTETLAATFVKGSFKKLEEVEGDTEKGKKKLLIIFRKGLNSSNVINYSSDYKRHFSHKNFEMEKFFSSIMNLFFGRLFLCCRGRKLFSPPGKLLLIFNSSGPRSRWDFKAHSSW